MAALPPDVHATGFVSRRRLLDLGHDPAQIDWLLEAGQLVGWSRAHYRVADARADDIGRLAAALDRSGAGARVGGPWACGLYGLEGFGLSGYDHVIIDPDRRVRGAPFTVVRSRVAPVDQATVRDLPALTATRGLIDAAHLRSAKVIRVAFDDARRARRTSLEELTDRAVALGTVRGAPEMRRIIASGLLHLESEGERWVYRYLWQPGDPLPEAQVPFTCGGRRYRLDFAFLDARLCLEYDGRKDHERDVDRFRDGERDLALAELDIQTLRISARMLRTPVATRRRILAVRAQRLALGLPPIVPSPSPC
ncbi:MAG: hypothetical protein WD250_08060 [Egibacteraceae bacterium]